MRPPRRWLVVPAPGLVLLLSLGLSACPPSTDTPRDDGESDRGIESEIAWAWRVEPEPPETGPVFLSLTLTERATGAPVANARIRVEATMSHPGMTPIFATARESDPGRYEVSLDLGMAGDWILLVEAELQDGRAVHRRIDLPGVDGSGV